MGGFTSREALRLVRGLRGIDVVGADVVEVSPPLDPTGMTAMVGATVLFEALCLVAEALAVRRGVERAA
jgi:guanidinopropionase